ncbi:DUF2975 domain-containing protein [Chelatococcus sp. SYSU_G07232]|uniref:DUF2975 domain-containing protein n=1 Tax=Chelatococcus albus TaxID=3047466 RepID=A0ABT7AGI7_9HYPH|nr:DUF2975 domain-containing protein [Chelatococcus sp. SYSU_G07232]MDJ1158477.1 DUF2975 domain-containing protein [Chelatococcus sp. SYSU_G07232]
MFKLRRAAGPPSASGIADAGFRRIRRIGRFVAVLAVLLALLWPLALAASWADLDFVQGRLATEFGVAGRPIDTSAQTRALAFALSMLIVGPSMYGLVLIARLFTAFARGVVFEEENALRLSRFALVLIVTSVAAPFARLATSVLLTMDNAPEERVMALLIEGSDLVAFLAGWAILAFAAIFREAVRLAHENRQFV